MTHCIIYLQVIHAVKEFIFALIVTHQFLSALRLNHSLDDQFSKIFDINKIFEKIRKLKKIERWNYFFSMKVLFMGNNEASSCICSNYLNYYLNLSHSSCKQFKIFFLSKRLKSHLKFPSFSTFPLVFIVFHSSQNSQIIFECAKRRVIIGNLQSTYVE